jgi:hypothetical protein
VYPTTIGFALMPEKPNIDMHEITRDFLVSIAAFATVFGIIYVIAITRYRERISMIEKGIDPSAFNKPKGIDTRTLKGGMVCIGIAMGLLIGNFLYKNDLLERGVAYFSMIFLFGGISLILNFIIEQKLKR